MILKKIILFSIILITSFQIYAQNRMYKNPGCNCCDKWANHLEKNGINLEIIETKNISKVKNDLKIPSIIHGCHTSIIEGLIVEGHVPGDIIKKVLNKRVEDIIGIAVSGMPIGSPGMEGDSKEKYNVMVFNSRGETFLYETR